MTALFRFDCCWPACTVLWLAVSSALAEDWNQWRGPRRNGISSERLALDKWPDDGLPTVAWRAAVGKGHSAISVSRGRAYTMGWNEPSDFVYCFDAVSGQLLWKQAYPSAGIKQWPGPRSTPTVHEDQLFTLGLHGQLACFSARAGERRWSVQLAESYNPDVDYGLAWSPLIDGKLLLLSGGKSGLAVRTDDGSFAWGNDGQHGACTSPVPFNLEGQRGVVFVLTNPDRDSASVVAVEPQSGRELWRYPTWNEKWGAICVDPIVQDNKVFITSAETFAQGTRFSVADGTLVEDWTNIRLNVYTGCCVLLDGFLYGVNKRGILCCVDWATGDTRWTERGFGEHGSLMAADGKLLVQSSHDGNLVLAAATPEGYRELRRGVVFTGEPTSFTVPVLSNGRVYCRSYEGEVVCLDLQPARARPASDPKARRGGTDASGQSHTDAELLEGQGNRGRLRQLNGAMACTARWLAEGEAMTKEPLGNVPPQAGTPWRANFYRVDYDDGHPTGWDGADK
jgi:outer membrane protein assembly factor BamB